MMIVRWLNVYHNYRQSDLGGNKFSFRRDVPQYDLTKKTLANK